jgi:RNA polymerase sigma factor (sigma-70 family)
MSGGDSRPAPEPTSTSMHVHRAAAGDGQSLAYLVRRFTPFLLIQAEHRLGPALRRHVEPEDVAQDVWGVVLRRIVELRAEDGRGKGALIRYLGRTLLHRIRDLARLAVIRRQVAQAFEELTGEHPAEERSFLAGIILEERRHALGEAMRALDAADQEVIVLRAFEGHPLEAVAGRLGCTAGAAAVRYHRALKRLRAAVPGDLLEELADD